MTTVTAERTDRADRVGLSVLAAAVVVVAEALRLVLVSRLEWKLDYPERHAVQGVLFTLVYLTYAGLLIWRGRTLVRRVAAPLLLIVPWLFASFWLVVNVLYARGSIELPDGEWWLWLVRLQTAISVVFLVAAWGIARRRGFLWLIGLAVTALLGWVWVRAAAMVFEGLTGQMLVFDLYAIVSSVAIPLIGCLVCWGIEVLARAVQPPQAAAAPRLNP